jgi:AraC-like DNA-binding protein
MASVTETCFDLGFESLSAFSTSFKAMVGLRPSAYALKTRLRRESERNEPLKHVPGCFSEKHDAIENSNLEQAFVGELGSQ